MTHHAPLQAVRAATDLAFSAVGFLLLSPLILALLVMGKRADLSL